MYVAALDSGLLDSWRQYFLQERIAVEFPRAFASPIDFSNAEPTNQWEHDQNSHATHVTSTILGYSLGGVPLNGVAPKATVIPVKVLGQTGSGFSSMIARGIVHVTDLKISGVLGNAPLVINMSLGGSALDAIGKRAVDYAVSNGAIIVAAAGNEGEEGMIYPAAYAPVISFAASGWRGQWLPGADANPDNWWNADQVADPTTASHFYINNFSSRAKAQQDLDVAAPGSWVVGPYQLQSAHGSAGGEHPGEDRHPDRRRLRHGIRGGCDRRALLGDRRYRARTCDGRRGTRRHARPVDAIDIDQTTSLT